MFGVFIMLYRLNLKDVCSMQKRMEQGKHRLTFREEIGQLLDKKFYILVLALPVLGVCVFNILPIVFMILIAFTNYGGDIVPPSTALNYFAGLGLALLLDKDCVKGKAFWRAG